MELHAYHSISTGTVISKFLSQKCSEGVRKVVEMERTMFEEGFIPKRNHTATSRIPGENDENNSQSHINTGEMNNTLPETSPNNATISSQSPLNDGDIPPAASQDEPTTVLQPFYGLVDLEKLMLQAAAAMACDGNALLDALVYFTVVPISDMYIIRYVTKCPDCLTCN